MYQMPTETPLIRACAIRRCSGLSDREGKNKRVPPRIRIHFTKSPPDVMRVTCHVPPILQQFGRYVRIKLWVQLPFVKPKPWSPFPVTPSVRFNGALQTDLTCRCWCNPRER